MWVNLRFVGCPPRVAATVSLWVNIDGIKKKKGFLQVLQQGHYLKLNHAWYLCEQVFFSLFFSKQLAAGSMMVHPTSTPDLALLSLASSRPDNTLDLPTRGQHNAYIAHDRSALGYGSGSRIKLRDTGRQSTHPLIWDHHHTSLALSARGRQ